MANPLKPAFRRNFRDADLRQLIALPAGASTTVTSAAIDMGVLTPMGVLPPGLELVGVLPALSTVIIPDTKTATMSLLMADDSACTTNVETLRSEVSTGAGGVGTAQVEVRSALPEDCARYLFVRVVFGANTTTGAALSAELALLTTGGGSPS